VTVVYIIDHCFLFLQWTHDHWCPTGVIGSCSVLQKNLCSKRSCFAMHTIHLNILSSAKNFISSIHRETGLVPYDVLSFSAPSSLQRTVSYTPWSIHISLICSWSLFWSSSANLISPVNLHASLLSTAQIFCYLLCWFFLKSKFLPKHVPRVTEILIKLHKL
jgi:hypothetical protein